MTRDRVTYQNLVTWSRYGLVGCAVGFGGHIKGISGVPRSFVQGGGGSTNSVEDRENGDLGAVAP